MSDWAEQYRHPLWQKKRLEVLEAANFTCCFCEDTEHTLHVHHTIYRKGKKPWEYQDYDLQVLCENCHKERHVVEDMLKELLAGEDAYMYMHLAGFLTGKKWSLHREGEIGVEHPDFIDGFCRALNLKECRVWNFVFRGKNRLNYDYLMKHINTFRL